ncbi:glycosyl transferase family 1 [Mycolicibacterium obuense]|uniref:Glycosyl transferase family 1 n=2 Tax=Mycolicibacterium obuense TaxID=1807 RepID=A0A0M2JVA7_9MYCO|nr:glycosyl transferase family 1 [Mycolicibacterium obuense]
MTREYPPEVYGGAGVHVTELVAQLRHLCEVDVHCMGAPRPGVTVAAPDPALAGANAALATLSADLTMVNGSSEATVVHSHTWYTGMAGHLAALLYGVPHVLTAHSLEPMRPWKAEQLGGGYRISSWVEKTAVEAADAVIAVSSGMRGDVLRTYPALDPDRVHVVRNGIDTDVWYPAQPDPAQSVLADLGVDPTRPIVAFVGRITRQKGVAHLVAAAHHFDPEVQLVLCAGAPDTPEIAEEVASAVQQLSDARTGVFWVREMLPTPKIREILTAATAFVCPSVYEPLGIVNLEAMACGTAVVASDVGGIPEVVDDGRTGLLVHYDADQTAAFERDLAEAVNSLVADPQRAATFGAAGRARCIEEFSWAQIAEQTLEIYRKVC